MRSATDDNLLVGFDREELLNNPSVAGLAGETVTATVEAWFVATNTEGDSYTLQFSGFNYIEVTAPGKNSGVK